LNNANLCGADLSRANFERADLSFADLSGADLSSTYGWSSVNLRGANVRNVRNAPADFNSAALKTGALNMSYAAWRAELKSKGAEPPAFAVYTNCDK
jgi:uncharacterized protein YjbI with pentapeptide repeats